MRWGDRDYLLLLWLVPLMICLYALFARERIKALAAFAELRLARRLATLPDGRRRYAKFALLLTVLALLGIALGRPQWGARTVEVKRAGVDVMVALDTSYSMAAEDVAPSRLVKAKREVERLAEKLEGNRLGLLVFAGDSAVECPLTTDLSTFKMLLNAVGLNAVSRGGTDITGAIWKATDAMQSGKVLSKAIVLVTDGEETEGRSIEAVKRAAERGIRVFVIGVGSETGAPIPLHDEQGRLTGYRKDRNGRTVLSRMSAASLKKIASDTGGIYIGQSDGMLDAQPVIEAVSKLKKGELGDSRFTAYEERFQIPLGIAMAFLILEWFL